MYEFHTNTQWYYEMQTLNAEKSVLPFIEEVFPIQEGMKVLEVGCAEGGVLKAFIKRGCYGVGVELNAPRLEKAKELNAEYIQNNQAQFIAKNIYDLSFQTEFNEYFDLIILKDVIEHIHEQEKVLPVLKHYLKNGGCIFFGFPPFNMPFGGHQQVAHSKIFSKLPYTHVLPMSLYKLIMKLFGEQAEQFVEIKETGISTARFERIVKDTSLEIVNEKHFLFNPIYEYKFGLKPRVQFSFIKAIPHIRDFLTTCVFYLVRK
jgi:SAM-dependent methyltransferase